MKIKFHQVSSQLFITLTNDKSSTVGLKDSKNDTYLKNKIFRSISWQSMGEKCLSNLLFRSIISIESDRGTCEWLSTKISRKTRQSSIETRLLYQWYNCTITSSHYYCISRWLTEGTLNQKCMNTFHCQSLSSIEEKRKKKKERLAKKMFSFFFVFKIKHSVKFKHGRILQT